LIVTSRNYLQLLNENDKTLNKNIPIRNKNISIKNTRSETSYIPTAPHIKAHYSNNYEIKF
jgi:hypothetical protein